MAMKWMAVLTVLFGLIVLVAPWVTAGDVLKYLETVMGILVLVVGAMNLK